jgi:predicted NAD/FAD-binding protein
MLSDISRFYREGARQIATLDPHTTVEDFVATFRYGSEFLRRHLAPLGSAIWSSPPGTFVRFPVRFVVDFLARHDMLELDLARRVVWRTVVGGSRRYVERLIEPYRPRIRSGVAVRAVERPGGPVRVTLDDGTVERFDHVILACHSDQALRMLADPSAAEHEILSAIPYERNVASLHTDPGLLPRRRKVWAAWNYHVRSDDHRPALTYDMNTLQGLTATERYCVTLNEEDAVDPAREIRRLEYDHPVYTAPRERAQARRPEIQGRRGTSFCGAYWGNGFHEDGVASALDAVRVIRQLSPPAAAA